MFSSKKGQVYQEYYINSTYLHKLYHMYIHQTIFDKILDHMVSFAILFTVLAVGAEYLLNLSQTTIHYIHIASLFIMLIFITELVREYIKSKTKKEFFRKHWLDVTLVVILSAYFLLSTYFGLAKLKVLSDINKGAKEIKHFKIIAQVLLRGKL